jgi:hypothetical protein
MELEDFRARVQAEMKVRAQRDAAGETATGAQSVNRRARRSSQRSGGTTVQSRLDPSEARGSADLRAANDVDGFDVDMRAPARARS